jgi:hypothetical protein
VKRRIFAAYPRRIAAAEAEVFYIALEMRVGVEAFVRLVICSAKVTWTINPDVALNCPVMSCQTMMASLPADTVRENRRGDNSANNNHRAERFRHDFSPWRPTTQRTALARGAHWGHLENADE